jgi:phage protein D
MTTPAFRVVADGTDITDKIKDRLLSLRITDQAGQQSDSLEIAVDDREKRMPAPRHGAWLRVWLGYSAAGQAPSYMGAFAVDEVDFSCGPRSMVIKATAAQTAPELTKESRTQSWSNKTLGQVVQEIAKRNGLQPVINKPLSDIQIKHEDQTNETDQAFLTRLAEKYKAVIKPADGKLVVVERGKGAASPVPNPTGRVTAGQATALARQAGFTGNDAVIMGAIAMAESSGNVRALNSKPPDLSYGLWQINMIGRLGPERRAQLGLSSNEQLYNPATNAKAARAIWQQQGFNAWSVYKSGAYRRYLNAAQQSAGAVGSIDGLLKGSFTIKEQEVSTWRATLKGRGAYDAVTTKWLDRATNKEKTHTAGQANGQLPTFEEKQLYKTEEEAKSAAESKLQSLRSGEVRVSITMPGRPDLNAEGNIKLEGFRPEVDGTWIAKTITHDLVPSGYSTSVECGTQGDENDGWVNGEGSGANNGKPAGEKARLVSQAAERARGMNTKGGPDGGNNACLFAVNKVLRSAGITPPWGNSNYVPTARSTLASGAGTLLSGPEPGAIAIMRDNGSPPYPHIGIVGNDGRTIISNSSSRGTFSWAAGEGSYTSTYGRTPEYWRLK